MTLMFKAFFTAMINHSSCWGQQTRENQAMWGREKESTIIPASLFVSFIKHNVERKERRKQSSTFKGESTNHARNITMIARKIQFSSPLSFFLPRMQHTKPKEDANSHSPVRWPARIRRWMWQRDETTVILYSSLLLCHLRQKCTAKNKGSPRSALIQQAARMGRATAADRD